MFFLPKGRKGGMVGGGMVGPSTFRFKVKTAGADTFQLPIYNGGTYDFDVDWGDGNIDNITAFDDGAGNHSYAGAGTFNVKITGTVDGWRFANAGDITLIYDLSEWGSLILGDNNSYFRGCANLTVSAADDLDVSAITDFSLMFHGCSAFNTDISGWDMSSAIDLTGMFQSTLFNKDIGIWNVSSVENMKQLFYETPFNQDIGSWVVSSVTDMTNMFYKNTAFNQDIGSWDVSSVVSMNAMFYQTPFNQDISTWVTSALEDMTVMFKLNTAFNQEIGGWDVTSVTAMSSLFEGATAFNGDISGWTISVVTGMTSMFGGATSFNQDIGSWDVSTVTNMWGMFQNATSFDQDIGDWELPLIENLTNMFDGVTLSTANYDALLIGWGGAGHDTADDVTFDGGNSKYSDPGDAKDARDHLEAAPAGGHGWTITDGGAA